MSVRRSGNLEIDLRLPMYLQILATDNLDDRRLRPICMSWGIYGQSEGIDWANFIK